MKRFAFLLCGALLSLGAAAQTVNHMSDFNAEQKAAATEVSLTGRLSTKGNSDFRQLRDLCYQLRSVDLSASDCEIIPNNAFHSRKALRRVVLPDNLKSIGTQAFFACSSLESLRLPSSVTRVEDAAFSGCSAIKELTIEGAPALGEFAFARLTGLKTIRLSSAEPPVATPHTFDGIDRKKVKLIVPKGSEAKYRKAEGWKGFYNSTPRSEGRQNRLCDPQTVLLPQPLELQVLEGTPLTLGVEWRVQAAEGLSNEAAHARRILESRVDDPRAPKLKQKATVYLTVDPTLGHTESYTLDVGQHAVRIVGGSATGVFYGLMTFDQLLRGNGTTVVCDRIPQLHIADRPRLKMRELMVDPARHFIPFDDLKAFIPEMARYKLNALHLHLVDDQAWRIEIKAYPRLTEVSSARIGMDDMLTPISGFYTQEQMRELVRFAATYHVQIIPEIEMPGHEAAAIHAYPELTCHAKEVPIRTTCGVQNELLCPGNDFTYQFLGNVFRELADIFPSPYVHLGGDEAGNPALNCWTDCPKCQALKKRLGITTTDRSDNWQLQGYLFDRIIDTLRTEHGKTPMFWYETDFKRIQEGCITFAWRHGLTRKAIQAAIDNKAQMMLCPGEHCYFDYPMAPGDMPEVNWGMPIIPLKKTYELDPTWGMGADFEENYLFGVAGTLWSECINSPERIYYQAYPRALALAEVGWSAPKVRSWEGFVKRLNPTLADMLRRGICFSMEY